MKNAPAFLLRGSRGLNARKQLLVVSRVMRKKVGSVKSYAQKSKQAAKEKSRYAMEESPRATSRCFMFMYFLLPH